MLLSSEAKDLLERVARQIEQYPDRVDMAYWYMSYGCRTTFCIAGWIVSLCEPAFFNRHASGTTIEVLAARVLGLDLSQTRPLFVLDRWPARFGIHTQELGLVKDGKLVFSGSQEYADIVAERIRFFIQTDGTDEVRIPEEQPELVEA